MQVIDLLVKIVNEESVPKTIKVYGHIYQYAKDMKDYKAEDIEKYWLISNFIEDYLDLKEEVEIIEDTPKEDKKIKYLELEDLYEMLGTDYYDEDMVRHVINKSLIVTKSKIIEIIDKVNGE